MVTTGKHKSSSGNDKASQPVQSPRKRDGKRPSAKELVKKTQGQRHPILTCYAFHPDLPIEAYLFTKDDNNDAYTWGYKQFIAGHTTSDTLTEANFTAWKFRRTPNSNNVHLVDSRDFRRCIMLRYVPEGISTPASRTEGLAVLRAFLMDRRYSNYPPANIITLDQTNTTDPHALDEFFMDQDIEVFIKEEFDIAELDNEFYTKYPELAKKLWSGIHYPEFALQLGFPSQPQIWKKTKGKAVRKSKSICNWAKLHNI